MNTRIAGPFRSLLFVPANKPRWIDSGLASGADALIAELEDAVPTHEKDRARELLDEFASRVPSDRGLYVRTNAMDTAWFEADVHAAIAAGVTGIIVPKVENADDVRAIESVVRSAQSIHTAPVELVLLLETATAIRDCYDLCKASEFVQAVFTGTVPGGDVARSVGFRPTLSGLESLYLLSHVQLAARAAGKTTYVQTTAAVTAPKDDVRMLMERARDIGYTGGVVIHPNHVNQANASFGASQEDIDHARKVLAVLESAESSGDGAAVLDGEMIDAAHATSARRLLDRVAAQRGSNTKVS